MASAARQPRMWIQRACWLVAGLAFAPLAHAQYQYQDYDDYSAFSTDPVELDNEVSELFGRFFQNSVYAGTNILTGGLGKVYPAGVMLGMKFTFYFDKIWAGEIGAGWSQSSGTYNETNTGTPGIEIEQSMALVPIQLGIRYGFDQDLLPRGFGIIHPYLAANVEYVFRSEAVKGSPTLDGLANETLKSKLVEGSINTSTGIGFNAGGGMEFDVYRKKIYLGLDLRYHFLFWSDADVLIGKLDRRGNSVSILGSVTYNY
jgi:hypothetical protein